MILSATWRREGGCTACGDAIRTQPDRAAASGPCPLGAALVAARTRGGWMLPASTRGYRPAALHRRLGGRDHRGSGLARTALGRPGACAVAAPGLLSRRAGPAAGCGAALSVLLQPCRDPARACPVRGGAAWRPGRRATLSRHLPHARSRPARGATCRRCAACLAARHARGHAARAAPALLRGCRLRAARLRSPSVRRCRAGASRRSGELPSVRDA